MESATYIGLILDLNFSRSQQVGEVVSLTFFPKQFTARSSHCCKGMVALTSVSGLVGSPFVSSLGACKVSSFSSICLPCLPSFPALGTCRFSALK